MRRFVSRNEERRVKLGVALSAVAWRVAGVAEFASTWRNRIQPPGNENHTSGAQFSMSITAANARNRSTLMVSARALGAMPTACS